MLALLPALVAALDGEDDLIPDGELAHHALEGDGGLDLLLAEAQKANAAHDIERERRVLDYAESLRGEPEDAAEVQRNYLRWDRPEGKYELRDGKFLAVVPTIPLKEQALR